MTFKIKEQKLCVLLFSKEGREFAKKYADSLFTTIRKNHLLNVVGSNNVSSAMSLFVGNTLSEAKDYYKFLLDKDVDQKAAENFISELSYSNPLKGYFSKKNSHLIKSGAGIEELITDVEGLKNFLLKVRKLNINTLLFALPDYEIIENFNDCISKTND